MGGAGRDRSDRAGCKLSDWFTDAMLGPFADVNPQTPSFPTPSTPTWPSFGQNNNMPFLFREPVPQSPHSPHWAPPSTYTPHKATVPFPQPELNDVDMSEVSPGGPSPDKDQKEEGERALAVGALRRVYKKRNERERSRLGRRRGRIDDDESSGEETGEDDQPGPVTQKTTNHYTLNVAGPTAPQSDTPYRLLGCVIIPVSPFCSIPYRALGRYVQVFLNGSLAAIALYLLAQFIFMIHTDVEHRVGEYSMEIVQEIAQCQLAYKTNLCAEGRIPAMTAQCASWETCMNRDPTKVGRAKITFEVFGEVINTFVEQISWKTLVSHFAGLVALPHTNRDRRFSRSCPSRFSRSSSTPSSCSSARA